MYLLKCLPLTNKGNTTTQVIIPTKIVESLLITESIYKVVRENVTEFCRNRFREHNMLGLYIYHFSSVLSDPSSLDFVTEGPDRILGIFTF